MLSINDITVNLGIKLYKGYKQTLALDINSISKDTIAFKIKEIE